MTTTTAMKSVELEHLLVEVGIEQLGRTVQSLSMGACMAMRDWYDEQELGPRGAAYVVARFHDAAVVADEALAAAGFADYHERALNVAHQEASQILQGRALVAVAQIVAWRTLGEAAHLIDVDRRTVGALVGPFVLAGGRWEG